MSWDDPSTDMAHCTWCEWDLYKKDATKEHMHPECRVKWQRRIALQKILRPVLKGMGVENPNRFNVLRDICRLIEGELEKEQGK